MGEADRSPGGAPSRAQGWDCLGSCAFGFCVSWLLTAGARGVLAKIPLPSLQAPLGCMCSTVSSCLCWHCGLLCDCCKQPLGLPSIAGFLKMPLWLINPKSKKPSEVFHRECNLMSFSSCQLAAALWH